MFSIDNTIKIQIKKIVAAIKVCTSMYIKTNLIKTYI